SDPALTGLGHRPPGALSVWAMLLVLLMQVGSGLMSDDEIAYAGPWAQHVPETVVSWMTNYHAAIGQWLLLALVLLHVAAILFYLLFRKENLIGPMLHGDKVPTSGAEVAPMSSRDDALSRWLALGLLLGCAALTTWLTGFAI
ncbi:cytochrome b/b6 domain-containing protein, partial [Leptospira sp. SA-E8]|uniref:cytochrome b/b6 domain-containing protein n=1 Tax=Leptospira sp. SA-E8 TaxID=3422259 RepID=UPI003EBED130